MVTILVVDDEESLVRALKDNLESEGFLTCTASSGEEAIADLRKTHVDLVLLDLLMPVKNGFYVLEEIVKNPEWKHIPVIVLSNIGGDHDIKKALQMGAKDYFVKSQHPVEEIVKRVKSYFPNVSGEDRIIKKAPVEKVVESTEKKSEVYVPEKIRSDDVLIEEKRKFEAELAEEKRKEMLILADSDKIRSELIEEREKTKKAVLAAKEEADAMIAKERSLAETALAEERKRSEDALSLERKMLEVTMAGERKLAEDVLNAEKKLSETLLSKGAE